MKKFGLLGEKLGHSYSPLIHSYLGSYPYLLFERNPDQVADFFKDKSIVGFNVTIPYKKLAYELCDCVSDIAKETKSVNTVFKTNNHEILGENTDYYGFLYTVKKSEIVFSGQKILILGSGGVSSTIALVARDLSASSIVVLSRTGKDNYDNIYKHYDADIIINCTPVGMYPNNGKAIIDLAKFENLKALFDLIYNPYITKLMYDANSLNIPSFNGLTMLVAQAKKAAELFIGQNIADELVDTIVEDIKRQTLNVILIGMPGSGKSSIGLHLSKITKRPFFDSDLEIEKRFGKSPATIIKTEGEDYFRKLETQVLADLSKEKTSIIATGGGVVTRDENKYYLLQNSQLVYIKRSLHHLSTQDRPLSLNMDLNKLYEARKDNYINWSNHHFDNIGIIETAQAIKKELGI